MNKAKAFFTLGIITIVAGASAVCLYLNDNGMLSFSEDASAVETTVVMQDSYYEDEAEDEAQIPFEDDAAEDEKDEDPVDAADDKKEEAETPEKLDVASVNEYLSIFSGLYFSEKYDFSQDKFNDYELLKFAYLYADKFEKSKGIVTGYSDAEKGMHNGIKASEAKRIIDEFFGVDIAMESAFTENSYQYFMYRDGYFYTPAADGISHMNVTVADTVVQSDDRISVSFTIYSDGVTSDMASAQAKKNGTVYASGKAELLKTADGFVLTAYSVDF